MTKTLEELKEMGEKSLKLQLEMMQELGSLSFQDVMYFIPWFTNHPIGEEIKQTSIKLAKLGHYNLSTTRQ